MKEIVKCFNEESLGREFFLLSDPKVIKIALEITFSNQTTQAILKLVARYLLHSNEQGKLVYEMEDILRKYSIVLIYLFLKERSKKYDLLGKNKLNLYNETFESILDGGITYDKLNKAKFTSYNVLTKLYEKKGDNNKDFNRDVRDFKKKLFEKHIRQIKISEEKYEQVLSDKEINAIINLLSKDAAFFYHNRSSFIDIFSSSMRTLDMLVAEAQYESNFIKFEIKIPENQIDNYRKNFYENVSNADKDKRGSLILGYMVNKFIEQGDLTFNNKVSIIDSSILKFSEKCKNLVTYKDKKPSIFTFITSEMMIDRKKIVPFEFIFNNKNYRFSNEGLELI